MADDADDGVLWVRKDAFVMPLLPPDLGVDPLVAALLHVTAFLELSGDDAVDPDWAVEALEHVGHYLETATARPHRGGPGTTRAGPEVRPEEQVGQGHGRVLRRVPGERRTRGGRVAAAMWSSSSLRAFLISLPGRCPVPGPCQSNAPRHSYRLLELGSDACRIMTTPNSSSLPAIC